MTLNEAIKRLESAGVDNPAYDARELFYRIGGVEKPIFLNTVCTSPELESAINRRAEREPLQYIIGSVGFYKEEYRVTPDCLIPRQDTEILVDYAVKSIPPRASMEAILIISIPASATSGNIEISILKIEMN